MITWKEIIEYVESEPSRVICEKNKTQELWTLHWLSAGMKGTSPACLYMLLSSEISEIDLDLSCSVIIVEDVPFSAEINCSNCMVMPHAKSASKILGILTDVINVQFNICHVMYEIYRAIHEDKGLQEIIDIVSDFFQLPASIMDNTFRFLARSSKFVEDAKNPRVRVQKEWDGLPEDIISLLRDTGKLKLILEAKEPVTIEVFGESAYFVPVYINQVKAAYLTIYETAVNKNAQLRREYMIQLPLLAMAISGEIAKNNFYMYNKAHYFTYVFSHILDSENVDPNDIRMRLQIYQYELREYMYLLYLELPYDTVTKKQRVTIADSLRKIFLNSIYIIRDNTLFFLVSRNEAITDYELRKWDSYLQSENLKAGFTGPFMDFQKMEEIKKEVHMALDAGKSRNPQCALYRFSDYQIDAMLEQMEQRTGLNAFLYDPLLRVLQYDEIHKTELAKTLRLYLQNPKEIQTICDQLYIHKNTLYKRLDKIRSIMKTDFVSAEEIMRIQLTFHMLKIES